VVTGRGGEDDDSTGVPDRVLADEPADDGPAAEADDLWRPASDWEPGQDRTEDGGQTALPPKVEAWRKRSATGAILTGFALGLQQAFDKEREEPAIVMQTSGDPPRDLPVDATLEQGRPRHSVVNVRPWLLRDGAGETQDGPAAEDTPAGETPTGDA
jgi:hypothetical protein